MRWTRLVAVAAVCLLAAVGRAPAQSTYTWNIDSAVAASNVWDTTSLNWLLGVPPAGSNVAYANGTNTAVFGSVITASRTLTTAAAGVQAGSIQFTNVGPFLYSIGTGSTNVALSNGAADATVTVSRGNVGAVTYAPSGGHLLQNANVSFANNLVITNNGAFGAADFSITTPTAGSGANGITFFGQGGTGLTGALTGFTGGITKNGAGTLSVTSGSNTFGGAGALITVNGGVYATGSSDASLGNALNNVVLNAGGTIRTNGITSTRAFTINGTAVNPSGLDLPSAITTTLTGTGNTAGLVGTGTALVSLTGGTTAGNLSVEGAQTGFTGSLVVGTPGAQLVGGVATQRLFGSGNLTTLRLQNAGTLSGLTATSTVTLSNAAGLNILQPGTGTTNVLTGRLGAAAVVSNGGRIVYQTGANGNAAIADTFGGLTLSGLTTFAPGTAATTGPTAGTSLTFGSLTRVDNGTLVIRATTSATGQVGGTPGANFTNLFITGQADSGGSGTNRGILPWVGFTTSSVTGTLVQNLATYDSAVGVRQLATTEYTVVTTPAGLTAAAGQNANIQAGIAVAGNVSLNSFLNSTGTPNMTGAGTITVTSGVFQHYNPLTLNGPSVNFGALPGYVYAGDTFSMTGATSQLLGSGGITFNLFSTTYNQSFANTAGNPFTGGLTLNGLSNLRFTQNNQLGNDGSGNAAGQVNLGGGQLIFNPAAAGTVTLSENGSNRPIRVGASNGTIGTAVAGAVLQVPGLISGPGQLQFGGGLITSGTGVVELNGGANTYTGGTLVSSGILRLGNGNQLGSGPVLLNGGTLQASAAAVTLAGAPAVVATGNTIDTPTGTGFVLSGGLAGSGGTLGTSLGTVLKTGPGTLTISGNSTYAGTLAVNSTTAGGTGGTVTLNGAGAAPELGSVGLQFGTTLNIDDSTGGPLQRTGRATNLTLTNTTTTATTGGSTVNLTARTGGGSSFPFGSLTVSGGATATPNTSTINLIDGGLGNNTVTFTSLTAVAANNTLNLVGTTNFGIDVGPSNGTRLFFQTAPVLTSGVIANVNFTGFNGSGQATYDSQLGVVLVQTTSGTFIDNIQNVGPGSVTPTSTSFTTTGATTANLGATIKSLSVAGHTVTLVPNVRTPQSGNLNAPADTLVLTGGGLTSNTNPSTITSGSATKLQFSANAGVFTTTDLTIAPNVTLVGTLGLTKSGAGALTVNGPNQLGGLYTLAAGALNLNTAATTAGLVGTAGTVNVGAAQTLTLTGTATSTYSGVLAGPVGATVSLPAGFTGTQVLSAPTATPNTFAGAYAVAGGTLAVGGAGALGATAGGYPSAITVGSGGTFGFQGAITLPAGATTPVAIAGTGATGRNGALENISGANSFAGPVTLTAAASIAASGGSLSLSGGVTGTNTNLTVPLTNGGAVNLNPTGALALNLGTGTLTVAGGVGGGVFTLPNQTNTLGNTTVSGTGGSSTTITVFDDSNLGATTRSFTLDGGGLRFGAATFAFSPTRPVSMTANGGIIDVNGFTASLASGFSGSGGLTFRDSAGTLGALSLTAAQTYTGSTVIERGNVDLTASNQLPNTPLLFGSATASTDALSKLRLNGFNQTVPSLTVRALGLAGGSNTTTGASVVDGGGTGVLTVNGPISVVDNTGTPGNAYGATLTNGTLDLGGAVRTITVAGQNNGQSPGDLRLNMLVQNGGITFTGNPSSNNSVATGMSLGGSVQNTYTLGTTVNAGTLTVQSTTTLGPGPLQINTTGAVASVVGLNSAQSVTSLSTGAVGTAIPSLTLTGTTTILTVNQSANTTFAGAISGTGGLTKSGTGILTLSGANTYTAATTVGGGTLRVNGSLTGSTVAVNAGGTIGGTGTISGGTTTLAAGSTLAPGASIGTLTSGSTVTINGSGASPATTVWQVELNGVAPNTLATAEAGAANVDRLVVTGAGNNLALVGDPTNRIRIDLSAVGGTFSNSTSRVYYQIAAVTGGGTINGFDQNNFEFGGQFSVAGAFPQIELSGTNFLVVSFIPVPEPATVLAVSAVGLAAVRLIRRRRVTA